MAQALSPQPEPAAIAEPPPPAEPQPAPEQVEKPQPDPAAASEQYVPSYPHRPALIRPMGRVPEDVSPAPHGDDLTQALLTATALTPVFATPDRQFAEAPTV